jgi:PST family polysaccharide transporter
MLLGLIRTKLSALVLGPAGLGLLNAYMSILAPISALAGCGLGNSAVREIGEAAGASDQRRLERIILTVNRVSLVLGLGGTLLVACLARSLSVWTFGHSEETISIAILSASILLGSLTTGQAALLQGTRRIGDLARQTIYNGVIATIFAVPLIICLGTNGILPMILVTSLSAVLSSWHYARRLQGANLAMSLADTWATAVPLLEFGLVLMSTNLMTQVAGYCTRVIIIRSLGLDASGIFSCAWTISSYYVGFILNAMGADFYPHLSAVAKNHTKVNQLVNEQTQVGLLLAIPAMVLTMTFAPLLIRCFYSADFVGAVDLLRWQLVGLGLRVISWPLAFVILATGEKALFFLRFAKRICG